jgi:hypothetical protein
MTSASKGSSTTEANQNRVAAHSGSINRQDPLTAVLTAFTVQLLALITLCLATGRGIYFARHYALQYDFSGYYFGARDWLAGINPYLEYRFQPPSSMLFCLPLAELPYRPAAIIFGICSTLFLFWSITRFARNLDLNSSQIRKLQIITWLYFPSLFIIERGNLDAIMLGCVLLAFEQRSQARKGLLLGISIAAKLYTGLLGLVLLHRRQFRAIIWVVIAVLALQIPFIPCERGFLLSLGRRTTQPGIMNVSPYFLFSLFLSERIGKTAYVIFWFSTLCIRFWKDRSHQDQRLWVDYIPWMISMPLTVFPYESIFLLPMLAVYSKRSETKCFEGVEGLFLLGFVLTGFQSYSFAHMFGFGENASIQSSFNIVNVIGLSMILVATASAERDKQSSTIPLGQQVGCAAQ